MQGLDKRELNERNPCDAYRRSEASVARSPTAELKFLAAGEKAQTVVVCPYRGGSVGGIGRHSHGEDIQGRGSGEQTTIGSAAQILRCDKDRRSARSALEGAPRFEAQLLNSVQTADRMSWRKRVAYSIRLASVRLKNGTVRQNNRPISHE